LNCSMFPDSLLLERLKMPEGKIDMVLDTDTYNEIDDQFALVYALRSKERLNVKAVYAAPFSTPDQWVLPMGWEKVMKRY